MSFSRSIFLLNLVFLHQVIQYSESHVGAQCAGTIAQQQSGVHHLANLTTLHNQRRLHTLTHANQIVMDSRDSQQRRYRRMRLVDVAIAQDDVVHTFIHT